MKSKKKQNDNCQKISELIIRIINIFIGIAKLIEIVMDWIN